MYILLYLVDGKWSNWGGYNTCSVSCGGGTQRKTRKCNRPKHMHIISFSGWKME